MMKTLFLLAFSFFSLLILAQGNLQFNQVKLVTTSETVPAGKVWKVESCTYNGGAPFASGSTQYIGTLPGVNLYRGFDAIMTFLINGQAVIIPAAYILGSNTGGISLTNSVPGFSFPLWLSEGTTLASGINMRFLNIIEFNVVP